MSTTQTPTRTRKSRASRAADRAQADQKPATVTPITAAGRSAIGDNGGGRKHKPEPQPEAEAKTVKLSKTPKAVTATAGVQTFDRHRGLAVKGNQQEQATGPNGAITSEAAMKAADKLARKLGDGWSRSPGATTQSGWCCCATRAIGSAAIGACSPSG